MDTRKFRVDMNISILGTLYHVVTRTEAEDTELKGCDGYTDYRGKQIVLRQETDTFDRLDYLKKVIRHEIVHAFFYESGLAENWEHKNYGQEETVVDWIAIQHDKMHNAFLTAYEGIEEMRPASEQTEHIIKWINDDVIPTDNPGEYFSVRKCSNCEKILSAETEYCHGCGAKMEVSGDA